MLTDSKKIATAVSRLKQLDSEIRKTYRTYLKANMSGGHWATMSESIRNLTKEEWEEIKGLISKFEFPCLLHSAGYSFCLAVYGHHEIRGKEPDLIISIEYRQFPNPTTGKGFAGQNKVLKWLSPITHNARNRELLDWYGFEPLRDDPSSYAY